MNFSTNEIIATIIIIVAIIVYYIRCKHSTASVSRNIHQQLGELLGEANASNNLNSELYLVSSYDDSLIYLIVYQSQYANNPYLILIQTDRDNHITTHSINKKIFDSKTNSRFVISDADNYLIGDNVFRLQSIENKQVMYYDFVVCRNNKETILVELVEATTIDLSLTKLCVTKTCDQLSEDGSATRITLDQFQEYTLPAIETLVIKDQYELLSLQKPMFNNLNVFSFERTNDCVNELIFEHIQIEKYVVTKLRGENHRQEGKQTVYYTNPTGNIYNPETIRYNVNELTIVEFDSQSITINLRTKDDHLVEIVIDVFNDYAKLDDIYNLLVTTNESESYQLSNNTSARMPWQCDALSEVPLIHAFQILYWIDIESNIVEVKQTDIHNKRDKEYIVSVACDYMLDIYTFSIKDEYRIEYINKQSFEGFRLPYYRHIGLKFETNWEKSVKPGYYILHIYYKKDERYPETTPTEQWIASIRLFFDNDYAIKVIDV